MSSKSLVIQFHIFPILIFQSTCPHSFPLTEQEVVGSLLTEKEIGSFKEQNIGTFYCQTGSSLECCPLLARKYASEHHSRVATIILIIILVIVLNLSLLVLKAVVGLHQMMTITELDVLPSFTLMMAGLAISLSPGRFLQLALLNMKSLVMIYRNEPPTSFWTLFTMNLPFLIIPCCCCCSKDDPSERRNMLHSVPNLDPQNYAPPAYSFYSSIPNRESGNRHSNNNPFC
ncbi:9943_t:CDS:2 [Funneliformis caledonium]|uniref:9943_t:CDS:1 n=1 Tax=Funneliformis caledonium TaxID=1117310 RepID=A0A9N9NCT3_9GLOM|nr:9943_t:CDS:2 [Funneliformis caledonium]